MKTQRGAALVEFAIIALVFFMILFGIIEFGRAWFTYNSLVEATRRGARVAAVCPANATGIARAQQAALLNANPGTTTLSTGIVQLTPANVSVSYLKADMSAVTTPVADSSTVYDSIAFVQVQIQNFQYRFNIPAFTFSFAVPPILTTLPSESLGRTSATNPPTRACPSP